MSDDAPDIFYELGHDLGGYPITDDDLRAVRSAARLTLNEAATFLDLPGALRAIIILADELELERRRRAGDDEPRQGLADEETYRLIEKGTAGLLRPLEQNELADEAALLLEELERCRSEHGQGDG